MYNISVTKKLFNMGVLDMIPKQNHNFKFNAVVTPKDEMEKLSIIFEL